jgi:hypothetical protein
VVIVRSTKPLPRPSIARAAKLGQLRVIDESGEDYLYPQKSFIPAELPRAVRRAVLQAA